MLCDRMGIDIWEVVDAAATKPYGFMRFEPGPGDGRALPAGRPLLPGLAGARVRHADGVHRARRRGQPAHAVLLRRAASRGALNDHSKPVRGSRVAIVGVSYKPGVGDLRESPALKIIRLLRERGADVVYHDDYVAELPSTTSSLAPLEWRSEARLRGDRDARIRGSTWSAIVREAPLVVDFRGVTRGIDRVEPRPAVSEA